MMRDGLPEKSGPCGAGRLRPSPSDRPADPCRWRRRRLASRGCGEWVRRLRGGGRHPPLPDGDDRGRSPLGPIDPGPPAPPPAGAEPGGALGDEALAPRALRRGCPPRLPVARGRPGDGRRAGGSATGRGVPPPTRANRGPGPLRPDVPAPALGRGRRVGPVPLQRHRPPPPGRRRRRTQDRPRKPMRTATKKPKARAKEAAARKAPAEH